MTTDLKKIILLNRQNNYVESGNIAKNFNILATSLNSNYFNDLTRIFSEHLHLDKFLNTSANLFLVTISSIE